jgi:two-component system response regulator YesN
MQRALRVLINNIDFTDKIEECKPSVQYSIRERMKSIPLLEVYLEKGQKEEAVDLLESIIELFSKNNVDINIIYEAFYTIAAIFLKCLNEWGLAENMEEELGINELFVFFQKNQWHQVSNRINRLIDYIFLRKQKDFIDSTDKVVKLIETYIERNLAGDISLNKIAEVVHFNPAYLSRLYKSTTGKSISDFICETKILRSKKLLSNNEYKIYEVASSIGFENASYFAQFFKKCTGQTPQEFRYSLREDISLIAL